MTIYRFKFKGMTLRFDVETDGTLGQAIIHVCNERMLLLQDLESVQVIFNGKVEGEIVMKKGGENENS
jgi:hypothetical protein